MQIGLFISFNQLAVAICFFTIWQLSKEFCLPCQHLRAVLLLESIQYFNFHTIDLSDNLLELPLWGLNHLFFYYAVHSTKLTDWLYTGFFAGLSMMAKYYSGMLLLAMFLFLLSTPSLRQSLNLNLLSRCSNFLLVITPHCYLVILS